MAAGYKLLDPQSVDPQFGKSTPGKLAMWMFLMTDAMSFAGFLLAMAVVRSTRDWPNPLEVFNLPLAVVMTLILALSSLTMVLSIDACRMKKRQEMLDWLLATIILGTVFVFLQAYEYLHLIHEGMTLTQFLHGDDLFATTFYLVTGFHGLHVVIGVVYLICQYRFALQGRYDQGNHGKLELAGLFWHFVDLVWILVFTFIYLI